MTQLRDLGPNPPEYNGEETHSCDECGDVYEHSQCHDLEDGLYCEDCFNELTENISP